MYGSNRWQIATVLLLIALLVATVLNTCAVDRLERQVIRAAKAVENLESGAGSRPTPTPTPTSGVARPPGGPTGVWATGWGGRRAEVLHVEGAVDDAPLTLAQKPLPQGDAFVYRRNAPPASLNYYLSGETDTAQTTSFVLGQLLEIDPDDPQLVLPSLATSWEVSDDGLTCTFHLRRGVQFADGRPFTAADVRFSYGVLRDPGVEAEHLRGAFDDLAALETPDDHTVVARFRLRTWKGPLVVGERLRILDKGWFEERIPLLAAESGIASWSVEPGHPGFAEVFNRFRVPGPGTGPYWFLDDDYDLQHPPVLVQNPFSWRMQVEPRFDNLERIGVVYISDPVAAFEEFRKQRFDMTTVEFQAWDDEYSRDSTITSLADHLEYDHTGIGYAFIAWNARQPPFDDVRVRRAMTHLVDRQWIVDTIQRGRGTVATCPSKPGYSGYPEQTPLAYDLDAARALLTEAGWTDSDGDGVLDRDGQRFEFELELGSSRRYYTQVAAQLEDACKQVGIRMTTRTLEWATFLDDLNQRRFDAVVAYNSFDDPWVDPYDAFHSSQDLPGGGNIAGWHDARADDLTARCWRRETPTATCACGTSAPGACSESAPWAVRCGIWLFSGRRAGSSLPPTRVCSWG